MGRIATGDSVFVLVRIPEYLEDDEGPALEIYGVFSSEDNVTAYLNTLEDSGVDTEDFEVIERSLDVHPDEE